MEKMNPAGLYSMVKDLEESVSNLTLSQLMALTGQMSGWPTKNGPQASVEVPMELFADQIFNDASDILKIELVAVHNADFVCGFNERVSQAVVVLGRTKEGSMGSFWSHDNWLPVAPRQSRIIPSGTIFSYRADPGKFFFMLAVSSPRVEDDFRIVSV